MVETIEIVIPAKLKPLVPRFLERTAQALEQLRTALAAGDTRQLQEIGHRLRGTAGGYGFHRLGDLAGQLEEAARAGEERRLPDLVMAMEEHFSSAKIRYE